MGAIRLVALDLDGTILESGQRIAPAVIETLRALAQAGVLCTTATGRPLAFQLQLLQRYGLGRAAGFPHALMVDEREVFALDPAPLSSTGEDEPGGDGKAHPGGYRPHRTWNEAVRRRWQRLHPLAMRWLAEAEAEARRRRYHVRGHLDEAEAYQRGLPTLSFERPDDAAAIGDWLAPRLAASDAALACNRNVRLVQIQDAAAGKGNTLAEIARLWGIAPGQVLAIGDSANDFSMLNGQIGFCCATVGNGDESIKQTVRQAGGYVAAGNAGEGVVEILRPLIRAAASAPRAS